MAIILLELRKATTVFGGVKWSNRYFINAASVQDALNLGQFIWEENERTFHSSDVFCYELYANNTQDAPNTPGQTAGIPPGNQRGDLNALGLGPALPAFNVVRVDFAVVNSRPSRKFYRPLIHEAQQDAGVISAALGSVIQSGSSALAARIELIDVDGQDWTGSAVVRGITSRRLGKFASQAIPPAPPQG